MSSQRESSWADHYILNVSTLQSIDNKLSETLHFREWKLVTELKIALYTYLTFWKKPSLIDNSNRVILERMFDISKFLLWYHEDFSNENAPGHSDFSFFEDQVKCLLSQFPIDVVQKGQYDYRVFLCFDMESEAAINPELLVVVSHGREVVNLSEDEEPLWEVEVNMEEVDVIDVVVEENDGIDIQIDVNTVSNVLSAHESHYTNHSGTSTKFCSICLEFYVSEDRLRILSCLHYGHAHCMEKWLIVKPTCPECTINVVTSRDTVVAV
jgi:hypothetical protein